MGKLANRSKIWQNLFFGTFFVCFFLNKRFAHSLFFNELCEQIAQVAHQKWVICSGRSPKMSEWANCLFFWANSSFTRFCLKKRAICSENRWANSQPCISQLYTYYFAKKVTHKTKRAFKMVVNSFECPPPNFGSSSVCLFKYKPQCQEYYYSANLPLFN